MIYRYTKIYVRICTSCTCISPYPVMISSSFGAQKTVQSVRHAMSLFGKSHPLLSSWERRSSSETIVPKNRYLQFLKYAPHLESQKKVGRIVNFLLGI